MISSKFLHLFFWDLFSNFGIFPLLQRGNFELFSAFFSFGGGGYGL